MLGIDEHLCGTKGPRQEDRPLCMRVAGAEQVQDATREPAL